MSDSGSRAGTRSVSDSGGTRTRSSARSADGSRTSGSGKSKTGGAGGTARSGSGSRTGSSTKSKTSGTGSTARSGSGTKTRSSSSGNRSGSRDGKSSAGSGRRSTQSRSRSRSTLKRKAARQAQLENQMRAAGGIAIVVLIICIVFLARGCSSVRNDTAKRVVRSLISAYEDRSDKKILECYGQKENPQESLTLEINAKMTYLQAHDPKGWKVVKCDTLYEEGAYSYVYILYNLVMENEDEYPCLDTYMVINEEERYYVMPAADITEDMQKKAQEAFEKFMTTDIYKGYMMEYNTFIKKNPGYEERISQTLGE